MRPTLINELVQLANKDSQIRLLIGDVGFAVVEPFEEAHPDKFINCGIAEQNMVGVAAGMAKSGLKPFVYSMSNFIVLRALEQIAIDIVLHDLPVTLIGIGGGKAYQGWPTHEAVLDDRIMRLFPNVDIFIPKTKEEISRIIQTLHFKNPTYIKIGKY